ncbi:MAG TPA: PBP1A family penicillin-binding protein, partial [Synergistaceae bacterium]|nr:PBP1A family penicillin-binding protein [Synergistaceae bacterium]
MKKSEKDTRSSRSESSETLLSRKRQPRNGRKEKESEKKEKGCFFFVLTMFLFLFLLAVAATSLWGVFYVRKLSADLPSTDEIIHHKQSLTTVLYDRHGNVLTRLYEENRKWVPLNDISPWMVQAVIAAEDSSFYQHSGLDFQGIARALLVDIMHKEVKQGGSTITQQVARTLFLTHEQTLERKAKEAILAFRLEKLFSKDQILEMYLNSVHVGHGAWGIGAASQIYFGKVPNQLSLAEASIIAGILPAPGRYSPYRSEEAARNRQQYVLRRMVELGMISQEQANQASQEELQLVGLKTKTLQASPAPYFVSYVLFKDLLPKYGKDQVYRGGLKVSTTLDMRLQEIAQQSIQELRTDGAIVALDAATGEILALVGGKDFAISKFNRATQAYRQPGSSFKPFTYLAAFDSGLRPLDRLLDAPLSFDNGWAPGNYGGDYHGETTIANALIHSYNTVAVRAAQLAGPEKIITMARHAGIISPHLPHDLSVALGSASVTPLEMAAAYCTFANGGYRVTPFAIREILSDSDVVIEQNGPQISQGLPEEMAVMMRSLLQLVVNYGTGQRCRIKGYEVFGKTGTTNEFRDAWFVGGLPGLVVAVYAGNDDHSPIGNKATGGVVAAPIWKDFVTQALEVLDLEKEFPRHPAGMERIAICRTTGYRATDMCPKVAIIMPSHLTPTAVCPLHGGNIMEAENDPEAPKLFLAQGDELLVEK